MVNKSKKAENEPISLSWTWRLEILDDTLLHGNMLLHINSLVKKLLLMIPTKDIIRSSVCINKMLIIR